MVKVSVIIPVYNDEQYLEECLESVVRQTLEEKEIICINDGSTDRTPEILDKFQKENKNIIIEHQENQGVSAARNRGMELAKGEYVAFMDGDDYYPSDDVLEYLYHNAIKEKVEICGGSYAQDFNGQRITEFGDFLSDQIFNTDRRMTFSEYGFPLGFTRFLYKREMLRQNKIIFPDFKRFEDPLFLVRAMSSTVTFYAVKKITYCHRVGIHTKAYGIEDVDNLLDSIFEMIKIGRQKGYDKLQKICAELLVNNYYQYICRQIINGREGILEKLNLLKQNVDKSIVEENKDLFFYFEKAGVEAFLKETEKAVLSLKKVCSGYDKIVIYGAGNIGKLTIEILLEFAKDKIMGFAITNAPKETENRNGLPVLPITSWLELKEDGLFVIAVRKSYQEEIQNTLKALAVKNVITVDYGQLLLYRECFSTNQRGMKKDGN